MSSDSHNVKWPTLGILKKVTVLPLIKKMLQRNITITTIQGTCSPHSPGDFSESNPQRTTTKWRTSHLDSVTIYSLLIATDHSNSRVHCHVAVTTWLSTRLVTGLTGQSGWLSSSAAHIQAYRQCHRYFNR